MKVVRFQKFLVLLALTTLLGVISVCANELDDKLIEASSNGQLKIMAQLIRDGANINATNSSGNTPLIEAAKWGRVKAAKLLLKRGADKSIKNSRGVKC
jgi:ankyrin repeat protein